MGNDDVEGDRDDAGRAWSVERGDAPLLATAIHAGHDLRPEVADLVSLPERARLREEDPLTDLMTHLMTGVAPTVIRVHRSRFEVDLNRPRDHAVYRTPEDAWGLRVWREVPSDGLVAHSLDLYDAFYDALRVLVDEMTARFGRIVVYDIHSYNHRREGSAAPPNDPAKNPELNVGTGTMDRGQWSPVVDAFLRSARAAEDRLDVRENVKFQGGHMADWLHHTFPASVCVLSIELKKTFMDEWTSEANLLSISALRRTLAATVDPVLKALERCEDVRDS